MVTRIQIFPRFPPAAILRSLMRTSRWSIANFSICHGPYSDFARKLLGKHAECRIMCTQCIFLWRSNIKWQTLLIFLFRSCVRNNQMSFDLTVAILTWLHEVHLCLCLLWNHKSMECSFSLVNLRDADTICSIFYLVSISLFMFKIDWFQAGS